MLTRTFLYMLSVILAFRFNYTGKVTELLRFCVHGTDNIIRFLHHFTQTDETRLCIILSQTSFSNDKVRT